MIINLYGVRNDLSLELEKRGDTLVVNGEPFDFSRIGEGDTLPADAISSEFFTREVTRIGGELIFHINLPNPVNYSPEQAFPSPVSIKANGAVNLPKPLAPIAKLEVSQDE